MRKREHMGPEDLIFLLWEVLNASFLKQLIRLMESSQNVTPTGVG
jgi:hypothetical protein